MYSGGSGGVSSISVEIMLIVVTYDVNTEDEAGKKRLRKVAKVCVSYGLRVQNSVFECNVDESQYKLLKKEVIEKIDQEKDSVRFYNLGNRYSSKIEHYGSKNVKNQEGVLVF